MSYPFSTQSVVLVAVLGTVLPVLYRIVSSPLTLVLISPFVLLFLGLAFLALHVFIGHILDSRKPRHARNAVTNVAKPFAFSTPAAWQAVMTRSQWSQNTPQSFNPLYPELPMVSAALNDILIMIVRDFVLTWYKELSSSPSFPMAVSSVLHDSISQLLDRAAAIDIPTLVVKRILPRITDHIELFRQSEIALRGAALERRLTHSEELDMMLASRYGAGRDKGKLHPAIENLSTTFTRQSEETHLKQLVDQALPYVLPETESKSKALKTVVRELAACAVLYPVMEMVSDPDFWNRTIDHVATAAIHEQKLITKVRNVLEAQSPRPQNQKRISTINSDRLALTTETITIRTDSHQFESFLQSIHRCSSLLDARRLKNDVLGEIRRTRILLSNHEKDDWINGEKTEDVVAFLDRLYTAKRKAEQRIVELGGGEDSKKQSIYQEASSLTNSGITLRDILSSPSSLSYFMEFMDRRNRSLLVQFWLTVETFKNPLEAIDSSSEDDEDDPVQDASTAVTVKEDISMIHDLYFSGAVHPMLSSIPKKYVESIRAFARNEVENSHVVQRRVRKSVLLAQRQVERDMEHDFEDFGSSELWFRVMSDADFTSRVPPSPKDKRISKVRPGGSRTSNTQKSDRPSFLPRSESAPGPFPKTEMSGSTQSLRSVASIASAQPSSMTRPAKSNIEVLMSPIADPSSDSERAPLFDDPDDRAQRAEEHRMDAIHAALTDIMALDEAHEEEVDDRVSMFLSLRSPKNRREKGIAVKDGEEHSTEPDEDVPDEVEDGRGSFQLAGPGDLQLSYEIARLGEKIANLQAQEAILNNLIKKAELTGDNQELRLLNRSKSSMSRELREINFQKVQYEQQESTNRLVSDRTKVSIVSSTVGEEEGKSVVRYLIEVQQLGLDGTFSSGWVVARRYNEFLNMHNKLREKHGAVRNSEFPGKSLVPHLSTNFVDARRVGLEKYLQNLISIPLVCESDELRTFLSRESPFVASIQSNDRGPLAGFSGTDLVRNVYRSVTGSIDDMLFGQSMLDVMIQRLTRQAAEFAGIAGSGVTDENLVAQALNAAGKTAPVALMQLSADLKPLDGESSTSTFSSPICDLLLAIFELNKQNNWLRRQAVVIILQQVLGGTIERKIHETMRSLLDEARIVSYLKIFRDSLWPGGKLKPANVPRTPEERSRTRDEANRKLSSLVPDLAANMIGRSNARRGARRIFAVLQNRRLNQHIAYTVVDEIFSALFPESTVSKNQ
ncbi:PhoX domain-containing protein [Lentinula aciculospora]|uniref:PhoX domain-containing protein n=1 Tax=Lentinula aciculospora TaxID=153920 RepID=A0A9W9ALI4_9AGAR|nr:PhoX domain-containing protein [Lentinula aciculospora]